MQIALQKILAFLQRRLALEGLDREENARIVRLGLLSAVLAIGVRLFFWIYTQRYWEDALITCLHSENLVRGLGLSHFRPGEPPLHGFTSPLSVLVPLIGDLMHVGFGVDFLKLVSLPAAFLSVLYVLAFGIHPKVRLPHPLIAMVMGYVAFEHHQILFGMAGMETQLSILILLMSLYYTVAWKPIPLGISLGLCMLVRPDYGFWTVIVGVYGLFRAPKTLWKVVAVAVAFVCALVAVHHVVLWLPYPPHHHRQRARLRQMVGQGRRGQSGRYQTTGLDHDGGTPARHARAPPSMDTALACTFSGPGVPKALSANLMFCFAALGGLALLVKRQWALWPLLAFVFIYSLYYIFLVPVVFPWYKTPYLALLLLLAARGLQAAIGVIPFPKGRFWTATAFTTAYLALFIGVLPLTFLTERQIQHYVENDVRKPAGLYLADHMQPDEAVGCEPLGYMGYYSHGNVYDWPGLNSRAVVAWSKAHPDNRCLEEMLKGLRPEYLFLRDVEFLYWFKDVSWIRADYYPVGVFKIDPEAAKKIRWLDRNMDTDFRIYKKKHAEDTVPYDAVPWPDKASSVPVQK